MGLGEKKELVMQYNSQGLSLGTAFKIAAITKAQYYYQKQDGKSGAKPSTQTKVSRNDNTYYCENKAVLSRIENIQSDPDLAYGYHTMTRALQQEGFMINHKKVYRLMKSKNLLKAKPIGKAKNYVKYRKVSPTAPLEVLEMDIKMQWVERERKHAYILNIIDTFTRKWLYQCVSFSIKQQEVKQAWQHIIEHHLQPANCLQKPINIEIRNDNDKRFSATTIQEFFKENYLNQVFTHPYTPQENAHVESFHGILAQHLKPYAFWTLSDLEQNLILFQEKYNNKRLHSSIAHLCPSDFEILWHKGHIKHYSNIKKRKAIFKLSIERYHICIHTDNTEPEGSFSHDFEPLDGAKKSNHNERDELNLSNNTRHKTSPSVASRNAKVNYKKPIFENLKC